MCTALLFCDCYLRSCTLAPSHFLHLHLLFTPPPPQPPRIPLLLLSKQWSVTLSIQYNSPHRRAISAACLHGDSITFFAECLLQMEKWQEQNVWCLFVLSPKKKTKKKEECRHGWLNWNSTSRTHLITNEQWTLQIHKFAAKHLQVSVHFYCFGSITRGNDNGCIKRLRSTDIWPGVIPVD